MKYTYDDYRSFFYINRFMKSPYYSGKMDIYDLYRWGTKYTHLFKTFKLKGDLEKDKKEWVKSMRKGLAQHSHVPHGVKKSVLARNLVFAGHLFGLCKEEKTLLETGMLWRKNRYFSSFVNVCLFERDLCVENWSVMMGLNEEDILPFLLPQAPLRRFGLISVGKGFTPYYGINDSLREFLNNKYDTEEEMKAAFLGKPLANTLHEADFEYLPETDFAVQLMKNAGKNKGVNVLLYGAPGTGKTSFALMLAACAKRRMYAVGENNPKEQHGTNYRLQQLHQKTGLLARDGNACLLVDEAEDIFSSYMTRCDKVEINRLLENNSCPVIWTTNDITRMDPAFIRRFTLAVHFEEPPVEVRQKMWCSQLKAHHLPHSPKQTLALAKEFSISPSMIESASRAAHMVKGNLATVRRHIDIMHQALQGGGSVPTKQENETKFNASLINASLDLNNLTKRLKNLQHLNFSLCLYGASGTGKSAYARFLAQELGLKVRQERASSLISAYVGETEHNIAAAFARAKEEKQMLIFDEADTFLQDRAMARHSWEISGVNEMLTWMEQHPYPFVCTTNLIDRLDPACLRRFSFKVKYGFLTAEQVQQAFRYFFKQPITPQEAATLRCLTPGDFAVVKNKAAILGTQQDKMALLQLLQEEQTVKQQRMEPKVGFCK